MPDNIRDPANGPAPTLARFRSRLRNSGAGESETDRHAACLNNTLRLGRLWRTLLELQP